MTVAPGTLLGRYHIISPLGEGGMGEVYLAQDTQLGRRVAIKFPTVKSDEHHAHARFLREARAVSVLSHRHIATIYDYGESTEGQPYLVMELVNGESLSDLLHTSSLTLDRAVQIIAEVTEALAEAHLHGIIHRDIKPSNVMLNERGEVKVLDFGLAKQLNEEPAGIINQDAQTLLATRTQSGMVVGTPLYLSPEQAMSAPVDARSDIFALGALLYECITGRSAFIGKGVIEITAQIIHIDPPPPSTVNPRVSPELDHIALKALAKNPDERFQTAEEMLAELQALRSGLSDETHRTRRISPTSKTNHSSALRTFSDMLQRPSISVGRLLLAALAIGLAGVLLYFMFRTQPYQPSPAARGVYEDGMNALRAGAYYQASIALQEAVKADDKFALAYAGLAEALMELDYASEGREALLKSEGLMRKYPALEEQDKLYLDAVNAMVTRDFNRAITSYSSIAQMLPDQPQVYLDLGRAYEKNEDKDKALEMYREATKRDAKYALAYLKVAILYGRADIASALLSFDKAESLYRGQGNFEGVTEVLYQRGSLFDKLEDRGNDARDQLQQALENTRTTQNPYQRIKILLQLSSVATTASQFEQAKQKATEAIDLARAQGMESLIAQGLIDLGNAFYSSGEAAEAERHFNMALEAAQRYRGPGNEARARLSLGSLYTTHLRKPDQALPLIEQALLFYREKGYRRETFKALTLIAYCKQFKGDYEGALRAFKQQLEVAQQIGEQSMMAIAHDGMGIFLSNIEQYPAALGHYKDSYAIYNNPQGDVSKAAYSLMNQGEILWRLGYFTEARTILKKAQDNIETIQGGDRKFVATVRLYDASISLSERRFSEAKIEAMEAQKILSSTPNVPPSTQINLKLILGLANAYAGSKEEAKALAASAVEMAKQESDPQTLTSALITQAEILLESGDPQGARTIALTVQERATVAKQLETEWRAWMTAGRASLRLKENDTAQQQFSQASNLLSRLQQSWGEEAVNSYLTRPDIKFYRQQAGVTALPPRG